MMRWIADPSERILVTGANGFVGSKVVEVLLAHGFTRLRCAVRSSRNLDALHRIVEGAGADVEIVQGNLLSREFCRAIVADATIVFHLAAGTSKSFAGCFMDSVLTTRNLLDAALDAGKLRRFVSISSLAVHSGYAVRPGALLDEASPVEHEHMKRFDPYAYGKIKQDELVARYGAERGVPYVIVRPGPVYGPGKPALTGRAGTDTFGVFVNVGGRNPLPIIFIDNCADAIVFAGLAPDADGQTFIAVDDDLPTSARFLALYKRNVRRFFSLRIPYRLFYAASCLWEAYSRRSHGQLPPVFNRRQAAAYYQRQRYSNRKLKDMTGWSPRVPFDEACRRYFAYVKAHQGRA